MLRRSYQGRVKKQSTERCLTERKLAATWDWAAPGESGKEGAPTHARKPLG